MTTIRGIISDFFYMSEATLSKHINNGIPFKEIYDTLSSPSLSLGKKRDYLFTIKSDLIGDDMKINIWERYIGDKTFVNTPLYDSDIKITVEDIVGN